jgi:hypothetical protein
MQGTRYRWLLAMAVMVGALLAVPAPAAAGPPKGPATAGLARSPATAGLAKSPSEGRPESWANRLPDEMPDVTGLPVNEATARLTEWNKAVVIADDPPLKSLDVPVEQVLVSRQALRQVVTAASNRPIVDLALGRRVPDLVGLPFDKADSALRTLRFQLSPEGPYQADWLIRSQRPEPGTLVEFGTPNRIVSDVVSAVFGTDTPPPPPPRPRGLSTPQLVLIGSSSAVGLGLLILLTTLALRRAGRRRAPAVPEHIEVRGHPGQVTGPDVTEPGPGASMSVRLESHYDRGTFQLQERSSQ